MDVQILLRLTLTMEALSGAKSRDFIVRRTIWQLRNLGLRLVEAKNLLSRLQEVLLCNQIDEVLAACRICHDRGKRRAIHDDRGCTLDTLYCRFRVNAPRLRQCACKLGRGAAKVQLRRASGLWLSIPKRPRGFIVSGRRLRR